MTTGPACPTTPGTASSVDGTRRRNFIGFGLLWTTLGMAGCGGGGSSAAPADAAGTAGAAASTGDASATALAAKAGSAVPAPAAAPPMAAFTPPPSDNWTAGYISQSRSRTYFVAPNGSDSADGSASRPFRTIQYAVNRTVAGDTIAINNGTYNEQVFMQRSGAEQRYITVRAISPGMVQLVGPAGSYSAFKMQNASFIRIQGLDVKAAAGHGIEAEASHHIQIVGNTCHDCGGSGISLQGCDYLLVEGNSCLRNASTNIYQTSGISIYQPRAVDAADGFHIIVRRNLSYANVETSTGLSQTSEGNGIILDDFHNSQGANDRTSRVNNYAAPTLVENNICAYNGGGGIVAYESDHVWVRNNTVIGNNTDPLNPGTYRAELSSLQCRDGHWFNNIAVADSGRTPVAVAMLEVTLNNFVNTGSEWGGNLLYDMAAPQRNSLLAAGSGNVQTQAALLALNTFRRDPLFVGGNAPAAVDDVKLRGDSPALNAAIVLEAASVDYYQLPRGSAPDCGALEAS